MSIEQYFIIVPDLPSAPRLAIRPKHLARATQHSKTLIMGGAYLSSQPTSVDTSTWGFDGSAMAVEFPAGTGVEGVREWMMDDPYVKEGVWSMDGVRIIPCKVVISNDK